MSKIGKCITFLHRALKVKINLWSRDSLLDVNMYKNNEECFITLKIEMGDPIDMEIKKHLTTGKS